MATTTAAATLPGMRDGLHPDLTNPTQTFLEASKKKNIADEFLVPIFEANLRAGAASAATKAASRAVYPDAIDLSKDLSAEKTIDLLSDSELDQKPPAGAKHPVRCLGVMRGKSSRSKAHPQWPLTMDPPIPLDNVSSGDTPRKRMWQRASKRNEKKQADGCQEERPKTVSEEGKEGGQEDRQVYASQQGRIQEHCGWMDCN